MKIGLDSYCFHRYFGEWYEGLQQDSKTRWTILNFLDHAKALQVKGVSLESCFLNEDPNSIAAIRTELENRNLEVVWAWGHPNGLCSGSNAQAVVECMKHIEIAQKMGAKVMRICAGSRRTRPISWVEHKIGLIKLLEPLVEHAAKHQVVLAIENHIDLLADELVELIESINSPWLGVCFDTANNLRMLEDPVEVARKLVPYTRATHIKDVTAQKGDPRTFAFWPSVPLGQGLIDLPQILQLLRDAKYDGILALEIDYLSPLHASKGEEHAVKESIEWLANQVTRHH